MKILVIHNYYRRSVPSGENQVVDAEIAMLRAHGHEVFVFSRENDRIRSMPIVGGLLAACSIIANPFALMDLRRAIRTVRPDVVHVHNLFPLISPLALLAVGQIPCVMTLHNYRLFCAGECVCRSGMPCTLCLERHSVWNALRYRCYRGSLPLTFLLAANILIYRRLGFWRNCVSRFVALTEFQRRMLVMAGLEAEKVAVKPNHVMSPAQMPVPWCERAERVVYVGRLSREKGVDVLIDAWNSMGALAPDLLLVGSGPEFPVLRARSRSSKVEFKGAVAHDEAVRLVASSKLLVLPSLWFEGLPTVLLEAYSVGTPVLVSAIGALPEMADGVGATFKAGSCEDFVRVFSELWRNSELSSFGRAAREKFAALYAEETNYSRQMSVYEGVL